jgi:hypothetical protein
MAKRSLGKTKPFLLVQIVTPWGRKQRRNCISIMRRVANKLPAIFISKKFITRKLLINLQKTRSYETTSADIAVAKITPF